MSLTKLNNESATSSPTLQPSTSVCLSRHQINNPSALISLTANNNPSASQNNSHATHQTKSSTRCDASESIPPPLLQKYSKDLIVTSKPPLPSSATLLLNRPPSRYSMPSSQRNNTWASSMTPRIRVPLSDSYPANSIRPVSPLTRGFNDSSIESMNSVHVKHQRSNTSVGGGSSAGSSLSKFKYNGPHQIYGGPTGAAEGPAPIRWPLIQSAEHLVGPPPPPPEILMQLLNKQTHSSYPPPPELPNNIHYASSPPTPPPPPTNNLKDTGPEFLLNTMLEAVRQADSTPYVSHQGSPLLTSPRTGSSQSLSFPSTQVLTEMEQATVQSPNNKEATGPFGNTGIPGDIQDDLLRIEMLLEFRKFKEALNKKIQNQNHLIQLVNSVNSRSQLNSQQRHPLRHQPFNSHFPHPPPLPLQQQQSSHQWHPTLSTLMDSPVNSDSQASGGAGGGSGNTPDLTEEKPVWKLEDITEQFSSPNFLLHTFMEPHHIMSGGPAEQSNRQQSRVNNTDGINANNAKSISLLQSGRTLDEFQDQSRSGFPSEVMQQQNPLLAGANQYQGSAAQQLFAVMSKKLSNQNEMPAAPPEVSKTTPLRIQVTPKESSHQQQVQPSVQQQYQRYLLDRSFQSLSPNSFKVLESINKDSNMIMRKPVAVSLKANDGHNKSPHNFSPDGSSTPTGTMLSHHDGSATGQWDRPSPYFPGFSGSPIDIKIRSPEGLSRRSANKGDEAHNMIGANHLEGVEELGNLLSQLPVLTRKEKVEEFQALNTLMPASPVTEVESETSMIPLVSSTGTLVSEKIRPDTVDTRSSNRVMEETEDEWRNLDPNKLNINELVTLGRKIYRILSQLSTTSTSPQLNTSQQQVITPMTLNVPSPNTPVFATSNSNKTLSLNPIGLTSPQLIVDFNAIPNPTFVTGPPTAPKISSKSKQNVVATSDSRSRTPIRPPHLFRKILHPPPTRWSGTAKQRTPSLSNPPPSASVRLSGYVTPKHSQTHQEQQKQQSNFTRKSMSSLIGGGSGTRHMAGLETKSSIKLAPPQIQRVSSPKPVIIVGSTVKLPETFTVRERYNNNNAPKNMSKYKHRRQSTPYPFSSLGAGAGGTDSNMTSTVRSYPSAATSRGRSLGRRNFIQENISKLKTMKKLPDSRLRPRRLPPVNKKQYEHVPSTIPGSRSRSPSNTREGNYRHESFYEQYRRSSSVPASTAGTAAGTRGLYSPSRAYPNRSISTPRPSTGMSVHAASSRSSMQMRPTSRNRPTSQGIIAKPVLLQGSSMGKGGKAIANRNASKTPTSKPTGSKVKFGRLPSKSSIGNGDSGSKNSLVLGRKSRSKTKKITNPKSKKSVIKNSSVSSTDRPSPPPPPKPKKAVKGKSSKENKVLQKTRKPKKSAIMGEAISEVSDAEETGGTEGSGKGHGIFNSESEQRMIREMVKAEMNMMVEQHVKKALLQGKKSKSRSKGSSRQHVEIEEPTSLQKQQMKHDFDEEVDEGGDTEGEHRPDHPEYQDEDEEYSDDKYLNSVLSDHDDMPVIESGNITPVYTPPKFYDESLFSLEKWINPDGSGPGSGYTSAKETPATTANNNEMGNSVFGVVGGGVRKLRVASKPQTVRFSLPNKQSKKSK